METKLFDLVGQWQTVAEMLLDPDVDQQAVKDTLEGITGELEMKADGYGAVIRRLEMEEKVIKAKKDYLAGIEKELDKELEKVAGHKEWMKDRVMEAMIAIGVDETGIKTDRFEFKIKSSGGVQALKTTDDVPKEFRRTKTTIIEENDNEKIREYLKDHTVDWAWLLPRKKSLTIKGV